MVLKAGVAVGCGGIKGGSGEKDVMGGSGVIA